MKEKILVVEDDPSIRLGLEEVLQSEGYQVCSCSRGDKALESIASHQPALVILDVMLPGLSGYDICRQLRAQKFSAPILMLTAKGQEIDKVVGLDLGADDYVTKPFGVRELLARIHALLRRASATKPASDQDDTARFALGDAEIDPKSFQIRRPGLVEDLTAKELKLLQFFDSHRGEVLSRDRLLNEVWGYNYFGTTRTLDQVIVQLRKKLGDNGAEPKLLLTVHGVGYKLSSNDEAGRQMKVTPSEATCSDSAARPSAELPSRTPNTGTRKRS
jgi:Response regulators consisting of a CheY-like receiver domain and a winged-helix DNA-binding domain